MGMGCWEKVDVNWHSKLEYLPSYSAQWPQWHSRGGEQKKKTFFRVPLLQLKYLFAGSFYEQPEYMSGMLRKNTCHLVYYTWILSESQCTMEH